MVRSIAALLVPLALVLMGLPGSALADSHSPTLSRIVEKGELRVGMSGSQPPLNAKSKSGNVIGMEADLAGVLAQAMGVKLVIVEKPFGQLLPALKQGEVDMVMSGVTITPHRNLQFAFVGPYFVSGKSILTKSSTLAAADEPSDIDASQLTLAALAGSTSEEFVKLVAPKAKLAATEDYDQGIQMVLDGKADAMVADFPICVLSLLRHPGKGLATLATPFTMEPIGIALPPNDPLLVNLVENYLRALQGTDVLRTLQAKWFEDGSWLSQLP